MRKLPFNLCIAFLAGILMNFGTPAFSSPTPTPTATIIPTPAVTATTTVSATPTPQPPTVTTGEATYVGESDCSVTLNGTVNANGLLTTAWFEYGKTSGSYGSTTATQNVSGTSDTSISSEIEFPSSGYIDHCNVETYYYRIVAQNNAGISYGNENSFSSCLYPPLDCFGCSVSGYVTDAVTGKGIEGATVMENDVKMAITDEKGYYEYDNRNYNYYDSTHTDCDEISITVLASGYNASTEDSYTENCSCTKVVNVKFQPITTPIPTVTITPTPVLTATPEPTPIIIEEPEYIKISPTSLKLKKRQSSVVIVTLLGADGIIFEGETITAIINNAGKKCISILPKSTSTDENGQATFTITSKNKTGNARITFKAGSEKKSMSVKVRGR